MAETLYSDYDEDCDVLYVTVGEAGRRDLSFEDEHGLIWRQTPDGAWNGVTVPDFKYFWGQRRDELQRLISERLPQPVFA